MTRLFAIVLILALLAPPAAKPACRVRTNNNRKPYCECRGARGWTPAPMLACKVWR